MSSLCLFITGCCQFLEQSLLDGQVLSLRRVAPILDSNAADSSEDDLLAQPAFCSMDAAALEGLEVLENSEGGAVGSLLNSLDHCASAGGRRLLREWLCRPLMSPMKIQARQEAVRALKSTAYAAAAEARKAISKCGKFNILQILTGI
jgi:DNA mismatch repair protein MSH6